MVIPSDDRFRLRGEPVAAAVAPRPRRRADAVRDRGRRRVDEHRLGRRRRRARRRRGRGGPVAPRRRGVRRRRPAVGAGRRPGPRPRAGRLGHGRSAQVVLPGLRHRRAARPRRAAPRAGVRRPGARVLPRRRDAGRRRVGDDGHGPRRTAQLLQARLRGHATLARAQALDVLEAPRDRGFRPADRGERRPGGTPRPPLRRVRRLRGDPGGARAVRRVLPAPARGRAAALALPGAELDAHQDRSRPRSRRQATAG